MSRSTFKHIHFSCYPKRFSTLNFLSHNKIDTCNRNWSEIKAKNAMPFKMKSTNVDDKRPDKKNIIETKMVNRFSTLKIFFENWTRFFHAWTILYRHKFCDSLFSFFSFFFLLHILPAMKCIHVCVRCPFVLLRTAKKSAERQSGWIEWIEKSMNGHNVLKDTGTCFE